MRTETFHNILTREVGAEVDMEAMQSLLERNPYSHVVRLAYIHCLRVRGDDRLESALDTAAVHLPDRKLLFEYLQEELLDSPIMEQAEMKIGELSEDSSNSSQALQRQYLTEAVQSSILMEVGNVEAGVNPSEEDILKDIEGSEVANEPAAPQSFLDFINPGSTTSLESIDENDAQLIERFLKSEKREKIAFFDPEKMARKSLVDTGGLVTDTLARIYLNQGNLEKALEAYQQLILKFPEKSGYFAARIQKVQDLMELK